MKLLTVAEGNEPPEVKCIVDVDLDELPELPVTHKEHHRRQEARMKVIAQNEANERKRESIIYDKWTELYTVLKTCTEVTAPVTSRQLVEACDMKALHGIEGGYFDGPRAWRILQHKLFKGHRSEVDKDYYRTAERLQRQHHLPDGCTGDAGDNSARGTLK